MTLNWDRKAGKEPDGQAACEGSLPVRGILCVKADSGVSEEVSGGPGQVRGGWTGGPGGRWRRPRGLCTPLDRVRLPGEGQLAVPEEVSRRVTGSD